MDKADRDVIKLTNEQGSDLVNEEYLEIDGVKIGINVIQENYDGSSRHTEEHHNIFQRLDNNKFYRIDYETSVKDSMGWDDCNCGETEAIEVFPKEITTIIYE